MKQGIALLLVCCVFYALLPVQMLIIREHNGNIHHMEVLRKGDRLVYGSIHSVSGSWTSVEYEVTADGLKMVKVIYEDQSGAGLPDVLADGECFLREQEGFIIHKSAEPERSIIFQVDEAYKNTITTEDGIFELYQWLDEGKGVIEVSVRPLPRLLHLIRR